MVKMVSNAVFAIIVLGIICFFLFEHYYREKHKYEITPKVLETATPNDVKKMILLPLLYSYNPKCFTIEKNIVLSDKSVIHSFLEEMKGREKWSAGKWSTNRLVRILFVFKSGEKVAFRASLHRDIEMAEYSVLSGVNEIYNGPNYANTGGAGLSKLLKATIKKSGVRWVNSSKDYWKIVSGTELIFKGVPNKDKLDHGVQEAPPERSRMIRIWLQRRVEFQNRLDRLSILKQRPPATSACQ